MPTNAEFGFNIIVGDQPLWEYTAKDGSLYVDSSVQNSASYKMKIGKKGQEVLVTPYHILIETHRTSPIGFYKLIIDGKLITRSFIPAARQRKITGVKQNNMIEEFVFTLPPEEESCAGGRQLPSVTDVGEIEVRMYEAIDTGVIESYRKMEFLPVQVQDSKSHNAGRFFNSFSKSELQKRTKGQYPMLQTEVGKAVSYTQHGSRIGQRKQYQEGLLVSSAKVYYRPRLALEILGIISPENEDIEKELINIDSDEGDDKKSSQASSVSSVEMASMDIIVLDDSIASMDTSATETCPIEQVTDVDSKARCLSDITNLTKQMASLSPVKSRNFKREVLDEADPQRGSEAAELCLWTEDEPSILYEGDEDCCITLIRKPWDVTILELSDEEQETSEAGPRTRSKSARRQSIPIYAKQSQHNN